MLLATKLRCAVNILNLVMDYFLYTVYIDLLTLQLRMKQFAQRLLYGISCAVHKTSEKGSNEKGYSKQKRKFTQTSQEPLHTRKSG